MRKVSAGLAVLVSLLVAAPASADSAPVLPFAGYDDHGDPTLNALAIALSAKDLHWRRCPPGGAACEPVAGGARVSAGETAPGTVFEAYYAENGQEVSARTTPWKGRVAATSAPSVSGDPIVGAAYAASPGAWTGGFDADVIPSNWVHDSADRGVVVCRNTDATDCYWPNAGTIAARWAGWYLFAVETLRAGAQGGFVRLDPGECVGCPPPQPQPTTLQPSAVQAVSGPVGPIRPLPALAPAPVIAAAPRPPSAAVRARALRSRAGVQVASVRCAVRCSVVLKVSDGHRTLRRSFSVVGAKALRIARNAKLRRGVWTVRVTIDGKLSASGRTR